MSQGPSEVLSDAKSTYPSRPTVPTCPGTLAPRPAGRPDQRARPCRFRACPEKGTAAGGYWALESKLCLAARLFLSGAAAPPREHGPDAQAQP